jgi:hypothetical protein
LPNGTGSRSTASADVIFTSPWWRASPKEYTVPSVPSIQYPDLARMTGPVSPTATAGIVVVVVGAAVVVVVPDPPGLVVVVVELVDVELEVVVVVVVLEVVVVGGGGGLDEDSCTQGRAPAAPEHCR